MRRQIVGLLTIWVVICVTSLAKGQVWEEWVARYSGSEYSPAGAEDIAVDSIGNVYITGYANWVFDIVTIKYDSNGAQLWTGLYNIGEGSLYNGGRAITVGEDGNVYVTGVSRSNIGYSDYATIKYDESGNQIWVARYNGPESSHDEPSAIATDRNGNVYVTGGSSNGWGLWYDYTTIKYDSGGNELWVSRYNGNANQSDFANDIAVDVNCNVYVTGQSENNYEGMDCVTIKYDVNGNEIWNVRENIIGGSIARALVLDDDNNVYITGRAGCNYATIKYSNNGNQLWIALTDWSYSIYCEGANALVLDCNGNIYVTGSLPSSFTQQDYVTVKYDSEGNQLWEASYNGPANNYDAAQSIAIDNYGVYITGDSQGNETGADYATIKYNATTGNQIWVARYNGIGYYNSTDQATSLVTDGNGNIFVTGVSPDSEGTDCAVTIKYRQNGSPVELIPPQRTPFGFKLFQNFPNPFNASTTLRFELPQAGWVKLEVLDLNGRNVGAHSSAPSVGFGESDLQYFPAGVHEIIFDGSELPSGVYFYRLQAGDFQAAGKMVLLK